MRAIEDWEDEQLKNLENNYRDKGVTEGGPYSLAEVLLEKNRRNAGEIEISILVDIICRQSTASEDGLTTYGDVWAELFPGEPWKANYSRTTIGRALGGVLHHCITNDLPILSVLVVNGQKRQLTELATQNIYEECKELGANVGYDPESYVQGTVDGAIAFAAKRCAGA